MFFSSSILSFLYLFFSLLQMARKRSKEFIDIVSTQESDGVATEDQFESLSNTESDDFE